MALEIFKLVGSIFVDSDAADKSLQKTDKQANKVGETFSNVVGFAGKMGKAIVDASLVAGAAVTAFSAKATAMYGDYEQAIGGIETLFGDSASTVIANAEQAYKNAGMSATEYMETVTGFSASLLQSLGGDTATAAESANMALIDMADNANKMGTSLESIQNAYSGFAKQNYTMLDNLSLGYGGTKQEMERLLADAEKFSGIKYDINNLNDVYSAIHVIQQEMGIAGTTSKEASTTIAGSMSMIQNKISDITTNFGSALAPVVQSVLGRIIDMLPRIESMAEEFAPMLADMAADILPTLMDFAEEFFPVVMEALEELMPVFSEVVSAIMELLPLFTPIIEELLPVMVELIQMIVPFIVQLVQDLMPVIVDILQQIMPPLMEIVRAILPLLMNLIQALLPALGPLLNLLVPIVDLLNVIIVPLAALLNDILPPIIEVISMLVAVISNDLGVCLEAISVFINDQVIPGFKAIPEAVELVAEDTVEFFTGMWDGIVGIFEGVGDWFKEIFSSAWTAIKNVFKPWGTFFKGLWDTITNLFKKVGTTVADAISGSVKAAVNGVLGGAEKIINGFISAINGAISVINGIPGVSISKLKKLDIPKLAKGGSINGEGSAIVGEAGAELIDLPQGAKVTPLNRSNGEGGSVEDKISLLCSLMQELINTMPEAVAEGVSSLQVQWNDRELGRMVKAYE